MIWLIPFIAIFICISSIFFKELRKLAAAIITTVAVCAFGIWAILEMITK